MTWLATSREAFPNGKRDASILILAGGDDAQSPTSPTSIASLTRAFEAVGLETLVTNVGDDLPLCVDGAFIRTYTEVGGAAHRIALEFERAGLPVLDRPSSIARGCDKVHQALLFSLKGVPCPATVVVTRTNHARAAQRRIGSWPLVVKDPKGAFCSGVTIAKNLAELEGAIAVHCANSGAAIVQAFVGSTFDWRIGVLDHDVLFAAKYWMAPGSWKILDQRADGPRWGECVPVPVSEVPPQVLQVALAASEAAGLGLWGVDIKVRGDEALVIEINDNPNIDDDVEAAVDRDRVWGRLADWFRGRISAREFGNGPQCAPLAA